MAVSPRFISPEDTAQWSCDSGSLRAGSSRVGSIMSPAGIMSASALSSVISAGVLFAAQGVPKRGWGAGQVGVAAHLGLGGR